MTNGEMIQKIFNCEVCEPIMEDDIIHVIFPDKNDSAIGFDWAWWNMEHKASTTKNDLGVDCINRKSIEQKLWEHHDIFVNAYGEYSDLPQNDKSRVEEILNCITMVVNEPPATPQEPRKGHWIDKQRLFDSCSAECSSCHKRSNGYVHDNGFSLEHKYYDFCPNCGAKMVEPQESEDK